VLVWCCCVGRVVEGRARRTLAVVGLLGHDIDFLGDRVLLNGGLALWHVAVIFGKDCVVLAYSSGFADGA